MIKYNNEIDIIALIAKVFKEKKILLLFIAVFTVIGITVALNTEKKYTAYVVLAPEITGMGMSHSLGDLASMVGVDLGGKGNSADAIYPDIYPDVFASNNFIIPLFNVKVTLQNTGEDKTYYKHLLEDDKIPFWGYPAIWIASIGKNQSTNDANKKIDPFRLTKLQDAICHKIRNSISCLIDKKNNVITIAVSDNDPQVAAIIADTIQVRLQNYIAAYRTQKARNDLKYAQKIYTESKQEYIKAQQIFGTYSDTNTDVVLQSFKLKQNELENEMQLKYNIYNQAVLQLQHAKAKVQENTPAFTVIQTASIPLNASSIPRSFIVFAFIIVGFLIDVFWVCIGRDLYNKYYSK